MGDTKTCHVMVNVVSYLLSVLFLWVFFFFPVERAYGSFGSIVLTCKIGFSHFPSNSHYHLPLLTCSTVLRFAQRPRTSSSQCILNTLWGFSLYYWQLSCLPGRICFFFIFEQNLEICYQRMTRECTNNHKISYNSVRAYFEIWGGGIFIAYLFCFFFFI